MLKVNIIRGTIGYSESCQLELEMIQSDPQHIQFTVFMVKNYEYPVTATGNPVTVRTEIISNGKKEKKTFKIGKTERKEIWSQSQWAPQTCPQTEEFTFKLTLSILKVEKE